MELEKKVGFFDIESTGTDTVKDRIVELTIIETSLDFIPGKRLTMILNPTIPIPSGASKVHGITDEMVKDKPTFAQYAAAILKYLSTFDYIATFNGKHFDVPMLYEEFGRCGLVWNPQPHFDASVIFKKREQRTLTAAYKFYCGKDLEDAHKSENDVLATIEVLRGQIEMYKLDQYIRLLGESDNVIEEPEELDKVLIYESKYDNEDKRLTFDGKIILNDDGVAVFNFGKWKDQPVANADLGYINFILMGDFPSQTKNVLRSLLNSKK